MAREIIDQPSRTFYEYLIEPGETTEECSIDRISLRVDLAKYNPLQQYCPFQLNIPFTSAIMQSVSDDNLAIQLALHGGLSFIYQSQSIEQQTEMVKKVKSYKAGFVESDSNLNPSSTLEDAINLTKKTGHSTIAITKDGTKNSKLLGILTDKDYWLGKDNPQLPASHFMTSTDDLILGTEGITLEESADILWHQKKGCLPIVDKNGNLVSLVFRKDYEANKEFPLQLIDNGQRLCVGAGLNTRDYLERAEALINAGVDVLCFDSSDGFSVYQYRAIKELKQLYPEIIIGAGNVVNSKAFDYLVETGADFIKVGIGGGSICITRDQKGIGKGQATAIIEVAKARDEHHEKTGTYIPLCSDGGIVQDYHVANALAFGADFVMMGRYFASCEESPAPVRIYDGQKLKAYWGEGTHRAKNWQRYDSTSLLFEEGVDGFVHFRGKLHDILTDSLDKIRSTMSSSGSATIKELQDKAVLQRVSEATFKENKEHDIIMLGNRGLSYSRHEW